MCFQFGSLSPFFFFFCLSGAVGLFDSGLMSIVKGCPIPASVLMMLCKISKGVMNDM